MPEMPVELEGIRVHGLMQQDGRQWDEEILSDLFNNRDVQLIKNIPIPVINKQDSWLWMHDEKGNFTVKSCYRQLVGEHNVTDASFWRRIWTLEVPGKVTFFIWRTCKLCLPTASALREKRVDIEGRCAWCRVATEDAIHVLFQCSFARQVWESMGITTWVQILPGETILDIFKRLFATGTMEQWILIATLCWNLWNRRNKWVWNKVEMSVFGTKHAALNLLADWKRAQQERMKYKPVSNSSSRRWQKPPVGWVKVNLDAAIFLQNNAIGVGGVMRDAEGRFVCAMCQQMEGLWQPREAEAIKKGSYIRCLPAGDP